MGVSIYVGSYASCLKYDPDIALTMQRQFGEINIVLAERGIEQHNEPNVIFNINNRAACSGLMEPDTLMRDNNSQSERCHNERKTNLQAIPERIQRRGRGARSGAGLFHS